MSKKLTYGMVGGGKNSQIGIVHRKAINLHNNAELVCGAFSRDFKNTLITGKELKLEEKRLYRNYEEMAEEESKRPDKIDFVSIVTPNVSHYEIAKKFLESGINVMCEKPLTVTLDQANELSNIAKNNKLIFAVAYSYTGYSMVRFARDLVRSGKIGDIRFVNAQYISDWMAKVPFEGKIPRHEWRSDPKFSGLSNCVADIGVHVENLVSFITGLKIKSLCARMDKFIEKNKLDDNASILVNFDNGAEGIYWTSQIAIGHENNLNFGIYGTKGSIEWSQEQANYLKISTIDHPFLRLSRGSKEISEYIKQDYVTPGGHQEGYIEAFARIYEKFINAIIKRKKGEILTQEDLDFPTVEQGVIGMKFIEKCLESANKNCTWIEF
ncbi:Gfo/Idh/MocA family protein [Petrotoga sp. 9PWA.NaAc.5.4]|uniref:Gfo/Idh/MocA family protein n=1 Tax=Petrotoga sp. 9PWA.NaAc.5.4 TaxID=1434328 RepID=UPI000CC7A6E4|nr:Gfo/Idh/MocA family oxidoreductase [Petrotoga sp. 9PWA.NaAc.5.4]PNR92527.1 oxidoreductase [Petrotoga sp. 9PWA.NaAc.5.4]